MFPFTLRVGDVVLDDEGERLEVVERPTSYQRGKLVRAKVRRQALDVQHEVIWEAWRRLRVVRPPAA